MPFDGKCFRITVYDFWCETLLLIGLKSVLHTFHVSYNLTDKDLQFLLEL